MGAIGAIIALKSLKVIRGCRISFAVSASFFILMLVSPESMPAALLYAFLVPAALSIVLADQAMYESIVHALVIAGASPRAIGFFELTLSAVMSAILSTPFGVKGLSPFAIALFISFFLFYGSFSYLVHGIKLHL